MYKELPTLSETPLVANVVHLIVPVAEVIILVAWVILVQGHMSLVLGDREGLLRIIN